MLYRYSCKDMGLPCDFVIKCETQEEATQKALEHVREKHSQDFNPINSPTEINQMKKSLARSMRVAPG